MEKIYSDGQARAIGVSNYAVRHLEELVGVAEVMPMVNQVELVRKSLPTTQTPSPHQSCKSSALKLRGCRQHTKLSQPALREYCAAHGIVVTAYSPLSGADLDDPVITAIADAHGVGAGAVILRWLRQHGCAVLPKSLTPSRIADNLTVPASFQLTDEEMAKLDGLDEGLRINADAELIV